MKLPTLHLYAILCISCITTSPGSCLDLECNVPADLVDEIKTYQPIVDDIIDYVINGDYKGKVYQTLAYFTDTFGSRIVGSSNLEDAIAWIKSESEKSFMDIVELEEFQTFNWTRNFESLDMISPRRQKIEVLGLGSTTATPEGGLTAEVVVVKDFEDLQNNADKVAGKIVLYNYDFKSYDESVEYRVRGALEAGKLGAVASLIASVTPFSMNTPHTGNQAHGEEEPEIPAAAITPADAAMIYRISTADTVTLHLVLEGERMESNIGVHNLIVGREGYEKPEEIVLVSGHIDSWDVGQGVMDDAGGAMMSWQTLFIFKGLGLIPRRSVHAVFFNAEEQGSVGGSAFYNKHGHNYENYQLLLESDIGTFAPRGLAMTASNETLCILQEVLNLMTAINATTVTTPREGTADLYHWVNDGVPVAGLLNDEEKYFWYHHSPADTLEVYEPWMLDYCTALWAAVAYVTADLSVHLPLADNIPH